jgi:hypothetical protein
MAELMVSVTELLDYMRCRFQWDVVSPNRQSLEKRGAPPVYLHLGTMVHVGLAAPAQGQNPLVALEEFVVAEKARLAEDYQKRFGFPMSTQEASSLDEPAAMAHAMLKHYHDRYGYENPLEKQGLRYVASELAWRIPVQTPFGVVHLVGTIDGVAVDEYGGVWVVEHKTYADKPQLETLKFDHQLLGYAWALQQLLGVPIGGVLYDGLNKKLPLTPRVLADGHLSQENLSYTYDSYVAAIRAHYKIPDDVDWKTVEIKGKSTSSTTVTAGAKYGSILAKLNIRDQGDQTPFFTRWRVPFTQSQIRNWGVQNHKVICEMAGDPVIYPHRRWEGCWDCWVKDICDTSMLGGNVQKVKDENYRDSTYRPQYARMLQVTPENVSSLEDLLRLVER